MKITVSVLLCAACCCDAFLSGNPAHSSRTRTQTFLHVQQQPGAGFIIESVKKNAITAALVAVTTIMTPLQLEVGPATLHVPHIVVSQAAAMTEEQVLVADVWKEVTRQYVDTTYNGLGEDGWKQKRLDAVKSVTGLSPDDKDQVYASIRTMLSALKDPYTRFLTPDQYESLTAYARGGSAGIGVSLIVDPSSGQVVVANTVRTGPAAKGGIEAGDVITEVDGMDVTKSATAELVAAKCRGEAGTNLNIAVRHGASGKATPLTLTRAQVKVNPVEASTIVINGKKIGLLKVSAFSQETTSQVLDELRSLKSPSAIVMDLRGNAGGYMPAGVDVAKLFLPPQSTIISEVDKSGRATIYTADGAGSVQTDVPLYLLVDARTASASEILTAALQDNHRATVVGSTKTFGKGRIQNVQGLSDGSGIAVTKAKYMTPDGRDIHGVGISPNVVSKTCGPEDDAAVCLDGVL